MKKFKLAAVLMASMIAASAFTGCGKGQGATSTQGSSDKPVEITWWNYPNYQTVDGTPGKYEQQIVAAFNKKYPNIKVKVEMISFNGGPEKVNAAIASKSAPDLIYDYPGRIIDYARQGVMAPVSDMIDDNMKKDVPEKLLNACKLGDKYYMYPLNTTPFMMAFNKTMLEKAGILNMLPLDRPDRLWTTAEYQNLLKAIKEKVPGVTPLAFYCKSSAGDQATRPFIANMYKGETISPDLKEYKINGEGSVKALEWIANATKEELILKGAEGLTSNDSLDMFLQQKSASTIIYSTVLKQTNAQKKAGNFEEVFVPFPTEDGKNPSLEAFLGGIGIFDNGDAAKVDAAKKLAKFIAEDPEFATKNLKATGGFSVRKSVTGLYDDPEFKYVEGMVKYSGTYYNHVPGFAEMRTHWFPMLQEVLAGKKTPKEGLDGFVNKANATLNKK